MEEIRRNPIQKTKEVYHYKIISSPVGPLTLVATDFALVFLLWGKDKSNFSGDLYINDNKNQQPILKKTQAQLSEYFSRKRTTFNISLALNGSEFQKQVWRELSKIPYGEVISYGEQARRLGRPKSARAVGAANGRNPISIIVPCHRVIGASGCLTGFGGGLKIKKRLLEIEGHCFDPKVSIVSASSVSKARKGMNKALNVDGFR